jgi:metal-responsive CopG/Arc/MetJ family transcriptional regulator
METAKVAVSINKSTLNRLDNLVKSHVFPSRSRAVQEAVEEKLNRMERTRLARECARVDIDVEQALADEGIAHELTEWPEY